MYIQIRCKMKTEECNIFSKCLFFATHDLSRLITDLAEDEFRKTGLSPTYAFLLMLVNDNPGMSPSEISKKLHLQPSTITRFVDKLTISGHLERRNEGKKVSLFATPDGIKLQEQIMASWSSLHERFTGLLGEDLAKSFTEDVNTVNRLLSKR